MEPDDNTILYLQSEHRSTTIWEENDPAQIRLVPHYHMQGWTIDERFGIMCVVKVFMVYPALRH